MNKIIDKNHEAIMISKELFRELKPRNYIKELSFYGCDVFARSK